MRKGCRVRPLTEAAGRAVRASSAMTSGSGSAGWGGGRARAAGVEITRYKLFWWPLPL